ncbi:MAG: hypothetical protein KJ864_06895 [Candidatus Omnitrophica bacterium]|nr:hypothetical protein [Candidatus Omnitrophota bacterium]
MRRLSAIIMRGFTPLEMNDMQYVLRSIKDGRGYTGCTGDLRKRFNEHNVGL